MNCVQKEVILGGRGLDTHAQIKRESKFDYILIFWIDPGVCRVRVCVHGNKISNHLISLEIHSVHF